MVRARCQRACNPGSSHAPVARRDTPLPLISAQYTWSLDSTFSRKEKSATSSAHRRVSSVSSGSRSLVVKADTQGTVEAIVASINKISTDLIKARVLHSGVGAITESDIGLAEASKAPVIGFNVRANAPARNAANQKGVEIRYYSIIYDLIDDIKAAASGLLSAEVRENFIGYAEIREVFRVTGVGNVAGCLVTEGVARRSAGVRLLRDNVVIHEGTLKTLKRFKDEVREVQSGQECGMAFERYDDIRKGDVIEIFEREGILPHVRALEGHLAGAMERLLDLPLVGDVRGAGFFGSLEDGGEGVIVVAATASMRLPSNPASTRARASAPTGSKGKPGAVSSTTSSPGAMRFRCAAAPRAAASLPATSATESANAVFIIGVFIIASS